MPRLAFSDEHDLDLEAQALIASAERTGAPDPRVVRIMVRSSAGRAWVKCWKPVGRCAVQGADQTRTPIPKRKCVRHEQGAGLEGEHPFALLGQFDGVVLQLNQNSLQPQPDGPTIDMNSPSPMVQSISLSAVTLPPRPP